MASKNYRKKNCKYFKTFKIDNQVFKINRKYYLKQSDETIYEYKVLLIQISQVKNTKPDVKILVPFKNKKGEDKYYITMKRLHNLTNKLE